MEQKVLRIGLIQGGKIIEERLIRRREPVTIGTAPKNTLVVPASRLPKTFTLFDVRSGQYHLAFTDQMAGRVSVGQSVVDFASLKSQNLVKKKGGLYAYPLPETARGKVSLGEVTLLFQFVTPPPEPVRPTLPKEARGGWVKSIDKFFTALLLISAVIHFTGGWQLYHTPIPTELSFDQIPDRFLKIIAPEIPDEDIPEPEGEGEAIKEDAPADEPEDEPADEPADEEEVKQRAQSKEVQEKVRSTGLLAIIGARSDGASGGFGVADIIGEGGGLGADLDEALANVSGVGVATSADALAMRTGVAGGGGTAEIGDMATEGGGGGKVATGTRKTPRISGRITSGRMEVESTEVDAGSINRFIKVRMKSIISCYEAELKRNPALKGKLLIRITISRRGTVADIEIERDTLGSATVVNCVRNRIRPWRFPVKPEEDTAVSIPFIFAPSS
ncbi:MAG: AgmX/PglI C-terminal domain-containing protein [Deltaproteobacteria bacterium]|nr:AgmX/PglI C-terminal domain-containing protein [Deltaproteobacteria bacterium]